MTSDWKGLLGREAGHMAGGLSIAAVLSAWTTWPWWLVIPIGASPAIREYIDIDRGSPHWKSAVDAFAWTLGAVIGWYL